MLYWPVLKLHLASQVHVYYLFTAATIFFQCNKKRNFLTAEKSRFIRNQVSGFDTKTL